MCVELGIDSDQPLTRPPIIAKTVAHFRYTANTLRWIKFVKRSPSTFMDVLNARPSDISTHVKLDEEKKTEAYLTQFPY